MKTIPRAEFQDLLERRAGVHLSIYMPTHRAVAQAPQDPIRLRHLLGQAEVQLLNNGFAAADAKYLIEPAQHLLEDGYFWRQRSTGLALFLATGHLHYYTLPCQFQEQVALARRFQIRPLLSVLGAQEEFYLLALHQEAVRLFRNTDSGLEEIDLPGLAPNKTEALQMEGQEKQINSRGVGAAPAGGRHGPAMFYSSGNDPHRREMIVQYFHQVDKALRNLLPADNKPVILAGVEYLQAIYREISHSTALVPEAILGSPESLGPETLLDRAWAILQARAQQRQETAIHTYQQLANSRRASRKTTEVVRAAHRGQVDTLFIDSQKTVWGTFDTTALTSHFYPAQRNLGDEDLLNLAAIDTLAQGGNVYAVEPECMPAQVPAAAILRFQP